MQRPDTLGEADQLRLEAVLTRCLKLDRAAGHVRDFAQMMTTLGGDRLKGWLARVCLDSLPGLHPFANGIERDKAAVIAGLSLPYSCGPLEGRVHHLKAVKRQMFNRAGFPLLRKRVLLTAAWMRPPSVTTRPP